MKCTVAAAIMAMGVAGAASAQTAEFKCPASGTQFTYKAGPVERINTVTGQDGNVCLVSSISDGKTEALRVHWGLVGSVDAQGESFAGGLDLKSLWPLKVGNTTTNSVTVIGRDGKSYTSTITLVVVYFYALLLYASLVMALGANHTFTLVHYKAIFTGGGRAAAPQTPLRSTVPSARRGVAGGPCARAVRAIRLVTTTSARQ